MELFTSDYWLATHLVAQWVWAANCTACFVCGIGFAVGCKMIKRYWRLLVSFSDSLRLRRFAFGSTLSGLRGKKMKPTINRIFIDRRAAKPHWYCRIVGGWGVNREEIIGSAYGCTRWIAYRKARRIFLDNLKKET